MAQKVIVKVVSDLSGKELGEDATTVPFALDGVEYEMDLAGTEADELRNTLAKFIAHARRTGGRRKSRTPIPTAGRGPAKMDPEQAKAIRAWAADNGYKVSSRGRIPQEVQDAYEQAHAA